MQKRMKAIMPNPEDSDQDPQYEFSRYVCEICDLQASQELINRNYTEILMVHMKLLKSKNHLLDIENILEEADNLKH
jgi:hypothetical protein